MTRPTSPTRGDPRYDLQAYEQFRLEAASQRSRGSSSGSGIIGRSGWNDPQLNSLQALQRTRLAIPAQHASVEPADDRVRVLSSLFASPQQSPVFYDPRYYSFWAQSQIGHRAAPPVVTSVPQSLLDQGGRLHSESAPGPSRDRTVAPPYDLDTAPSGRPSQGAQSHHQPNPSGEATQPRAADGSISLRDGQLSAFREREATNRQQSPTRSFGGDISSSSVRPAASARPPSKVRALISEDMLPAQNGHICKPTALAALDAYFSQMYAVRNIPLRKSLAGGSEESSADSLMRKIAKENGSAQGEILQVDMFAHVAQKMGYEAKPHHPTDINDFRETVIHNISSGRPLVTFFALNPETRLPSSRFNGANEHAALIVGYDQKRDTVNISHYGRLYESVPMKKLYKSMQKLPSTREQEIYKRTGTSVSSGVQYKYSLAYAADGSGADFRYSIVPEPGSGFKNTLFIVNPDPAHDRWGGTGTWGTAGHRPG